MTFEEWWNDLQDADWKRTLLPGEEGKQRPTYWGESFKRHAREAWNAATLAEREDCAELCEGLKNMDYCVDVRQAAEAIRARNKS